MTTLDTKSLLFFAGSFCRGVNEDFLPGAQGIKTAAEINWEGYALLKDALLGESQISEIELQDYSGKNYVYHFSRIAASNWYFGIAIDKSEYQKPLRKLLLSFLISFFISMIVGIVIMGIVMNRITQPIKSLNNTVQQFAYDKAARTGIVSNDEIGELGTSFNQMADEIEEYGLKLSKNLMYVEKQSDSYARFVPEKLLRLFDKLDITEVEPRDCKALEMTVMFSDIRSYTAISESLSSRGVFEFLNNYFSITNPIIEKNEGIIDKYIGDAIMALFPVSPDDALRSVIEINNLVKELNTTQKERNQVAIVTGTGLHFGEVELGTVGDNKRLQATVIGDAVNLSSRLESATKLYGIDVLISDAVLTRLANPQEFNLRLIDTVRVKGKETPIVLYEFFDVDEPEIVAKKIEMMAQFSEAMELYKNGDFQKALALFKQCSADCPEDTVSPAYIKRCTTLSRIPPGKDWAGISTL